MTDRFGRASRGAGVMLACVLLSACERGASTAELMTRGEQFMARRDYRAATIELKNAVAADAGNARARWLLGKAYLESGDLESAAKELDRARELGMAGDEVLPLLAQALLPLGRHDELNALSTDGLSARALRPSVDSAFSSSCLPRGSSAWASSGSTSSPAMPSSRALSSSFAALSRSPDSRYALPRSQRARALPASAATAFFSSIVAAR